MRGAGAKLVLLGLLVSTPAYVDGPWSPLRDDELHDPSNPALKLLQEPSESLSLLPPTTGGNRVEAIIWVGQRPHIPLGQAPI